MTELLGSIKDLSEYLKDLSEATLGLVGLFGGFLKRVAPPERSAWIWSGLASVVAAVIFLSVKLLAPIYASEASVHIWTIVAVTSGGLGVVFAFVHILLRLAHTVIYDQAETITGGVFTKKAIHYRQTENKVTAVETLGGFEGNNEEVWTDIPRWRRNLGISYAVMLVLILFGLCLGAELIVHPPILDPPKPPLTLAQRAAALKEV